MSSTDKATDHDGAGSPPDEPINPYATRLVMPADFSISLGEKGGTDRQLVDPGTTRRQPMRGFADEYTDVIDYIVRITHRIWEEKNVGYIYDTYRHNARVTDDAGLQYGRDKIVADTLHTLNAFPDARLYADEIVWAGDDRGGFRTSHRTVIVGHNTGFSKYGSPTGRRVVSWCIANCAALENEIYEEFVIYNNSNTIVQLGLDLAATARAFGNAAADLRPQIDQRFGEVERTLGQGKPARLASPDPDDLDAVLRYAYHAIWNWRDLSAVDRLYSAGLRYHGPTGRELYGRGEYKSFLLSVLAMFPDLALQVDELYFMGNREDGYLTSLRWSAVGTHRGYGIYGAPTGRRVYLWGITQHRVVDGSVTEEWMMFNEFELMQQLFREDPS